MVFSFFFFWFIYSSFALLSVYVLILFKNCPGQSPSRLSAIHVGKKKKVIIVVSIIVLRTLSFHDLCPLTALVTSSNRNRVGVLRFAWRTCRNAFRTIRSALSRLPSLPSDLQFEIPTSALVRLWLKLCKMEVFLFAYALGANLPTVGTHSVFESWACHRGLELKDDICKNLDKYEDERWVVDYFHFRHSLESNDRKVSSFPQPQA